jgi:peptide alpha-N-acetyltransferase
LINGHVERTHANHRVIVDSAPKSENAKFDQVLKNNASIVPETKDLKSFNDNYLAKHKDCARRTQAGLKVRQLLDPSTKAQNEKGVIGAIDKADMREALEGLDILKAWKSDAKAREEYIGKAKSKWPEASVFK